MMLVLLMASSTLAAEETNSSLWGGLTKLCPWDPAALNLVENSSFEERDAAGRIASWKIPLGALLPTQDESRTGKTSLLLKDSNKVRWTPAALQSLELAPGWYDLSGWVKALEAGGNNPGAGGRIEVRGSHTNAATPVVLGTTDWQKVEHEKFLSPGGPVEVRLTGYRKPVGSLFFDDVELKRLIPPLVEGFLLYPNYRGMLFPDRRQTIRMAVRVRPNEVGLRSADLRVELSVMPEEGDEPALENKLAPSGEEFVMELDAGGLPTGPYLLNLRTVRATDGETVSHYPSHRIFKLSEEDRKQFHTYVDDDNVLVLDRERKFALGIYNTGGYSASPTSYGPLVAKLSEAPLNLYINYWLGGTSTQVISALTSAFRSRGIHYLHTVNAWYEDNSRWSEVSRCVLEGSAQKLGESAYAACRARELRSLRGLAGWYTVDEQPASRADRAFQQYRTLRENDPDGVTFIAQNRPQELVRWRDVADVMGIDPYPIYNIPEGQLSPMEMVFDWVASAQNAVHGSRPVWAVIQFFPFGSKGHWPTYPELRTMSYMAIVGGAKGLFYWSYGARGLAWVKDPIRKEEIWQRLVSVTKEIGTLEPFLLQPDATDVLGGAPFSGGIRVLAKRHEGERLVIAVNITPKEVLADFRLNQPVGSVTVVGEDRAVSLDATLSFRDSFEAYATHVYRVSAPAR